MNSQPPNPSFIASVNTMTRMQRQKHMSGPCASMIKLIISDPNHHYLPLPPAPPFFLRALSLTPAIPYAVFKTASPVADCMSRLPLGGIVTIPATPSVASCLQSVKRLQSNIIKSTTQARDPSLRVLLPQVIPINGLYQASQHQASSRLTSPQASFKSHSSLFKYHPSPLKPHGPLQAATATQEGRVRAPRPRASPTASSPAFGGGCCALAGCACWG
ncbi:hypothetical protein DFH09DRAFT_1068960 [Mycena vulgaris]|nr:hypothetical protein DFH09DRAFT_1068960 [Mycena vulgaris]